MKRTVSKQTTAAKLLACSALGGYVVCYFATTETFNGLFGDASIDIRLFDSPTHEAVYLPLTSLEEWFRSGSELEFYGQVRNGASLPPPRITTEPSQTKR
jgi:hypothetical protein